MVKKTITYNSGWDLFPKLYGHREDIVINRAYSKYGKSSQEKLERHAKAILHCISGGDTINLLNGILSADEVAKLHPFDKVCTPLFWLCFK